ncbi:hypothetical protein T459_28278 [Capsicum annuum]|uniref:Ubiquitin-like protease family profile domain-containing protein n=1 Tax=Capsicum annuum TaxID=4072 RepID=A0A2G2YGT2_CAPAN|nr:hypothetical protein T459_28278 [Capsicum annuum]
MGEMIEEGIKTGRIVSFTTLKVNTQVIQKGSGSVGEKKNEEDASAIIVGQQERSRRPRRRRSQAQAQVYAQAPHNHSQNPLYSIPPHPYPVYNIKTQVQPSSYPQWIQKLKQELSKSFSMKDLGPAKQILGMQIVRDRKAKNTREPLKVLSNPRREHWNAVKWIMRYLCGPSSLSLYFGIGKLIICGYTDLYMGGDVYTRKPTLGYLVTFTGGAMSWQSRLQKCVALSTIEAEFIAAIEPCKELLWKKRFLGELDCAQESGDRAVGGGSSVTVGDNNAPLAVLETKNYYDYDHIDLTDFFPRSKYSACKCQDYKEKHDGVINALTDSIKELISKKVDVTVETTAKHHNITVDNPSITSKDEEKVKPVSLEERKNYPFEGFNISDDAPRKITKLINEYLEWIANGLLKLHAGSLLTLEFVNEVYISINCGDEFHWVLAVVILNEMRIRVYDSMSGRRRSGPSAEIQKLAKILTTYLDISVFLDQKVRTD